MGTNIYITQVILHFYLPLKKESALSIQDISCQMTQINISMPGGQCLELMVHKSYCVHGMSTELGKKHYLNMLNHIVLKPHNIDIRSEIYNQLSASSSTK